MYLMSLATTSTNAKIRQRESFLAISLCVFVSIPLLQFFSLLPAMKPLGGRSDVAISNLVAAVMLYQPLNPHNLFQTLIIVIPRLKAN